MLSSVLKTNIAAEMSIKIIRAFVYMRKYISENNKSNILVNHEERILKLEQSFDKFKSKEKTIIYEGKIYDVFAEHSWYFRNALVRANYKKFDINVFEDISFLEKFFYNLLANKNYKLKNRYTHIDYSESASSEDSKCNNCTLEEQAIINIIKNNPLVKQAEIAK